MPNQQFPTRPRTKAEPILDQFAKALFGMLLLAGLLLFTSTPVVRAADTLTPAQKEAVEEVVKKYIEDHPEIIVEAFKAMQARQEAEEKAKTMAYLKSNGELLRNDPNSFVGGNPDGDVTLVEFFDYRCGYCKKFHPVMAELLATDPNIRVVYKEFPILGPQSDLASRAAIAALRTDRSKYLDFHNALMDARGNLDRQRVFDIAEEYGLDVVQIAEDMESPEVRQVVAQSYGLAKNLGIQGTPGFVVGDAIIPGYVNIQQMRKLIDEARTGCLTC